MGAIAGATAHRDAVEMSADDQEALRRIEESLNRAERNYRKIVWLWKWLLVPLWTFVLVLWTVRGLLWLLKGH